VKFPVSVSVCVCVCVCVWRGVGGVKRCGNKLYNIQLARTVKTKGEKICSSPFFIISPPAIVLKSKTL